jgi:hypothetical protein
LGFYATELDATSDDGIEGICLFTGAIDKTAAAHIYQRGAFGKLGHDSIAQAGAKVELANDCHAVGRS